MELSEIENIIDELPFGIAVVTVNSSTSSPLLAGLQIGKMLGLPAPEDPNGFLELVTANAQFGKLIQQNGNGIEGQDFRKIMSRVVLPDDMPTLTEMINDSLTEKSTCDFRVMALDGKVHWLSADGYAINHNTDEQTILYSFFDITFRKQEQLTYQQELEYLEGINSYNIILKERYNLTKNQLISYRTVVSFGEDMHDCRTYDEAENLHLHYVLSESDFQRIQKIMDRKYLLQQFQRGQNHIEFEYRRKDVHQQAVWLMKTMDLYSIPFSDDIECYVRTYDISENIIMKNIIAQMENKKQSHFGIIDCVSGNFSAFTQLEKENEKNPMTNNYDNEMITRSKRLLPSQDCEEIKKNTRLENIMKELPHNSVFSQTIGYLDKHDSVRWLQLDYLYLNESKDKILFVENDITEQHMKELGQIALLNEAVSAREKAIEAKSSFFSSMSHDIRTPLNGIIGFTDIALHENDQEKKQQYLKKIKASGDLLMDLVNDTLDISRINSGKMVLNPEEVEESTFIQSLIDAVQPSAELKNVHLVTDFEHDSAEMILIDSLKMKKIFLNLLSNAIKFTPSNGTVSFHIEKVHPSFQGYTRQIVVKDTGIGMSKEFLNRLYEPFAQEQRKEAQNITGTGLGLTIVKRIVELMNGRIYVESEIGKGTKFTIFLPVETSKAHTAKIEDTACSNTSLKGKRVLLCEDNQINTELAFIQLRDAGMIVDNASNGQEALHMFEKAPVSYYDVILMDVRMPVMNGYEATKEIRSLQRADAKTIPILAMTADALEEDIRKCREIGMDDYISKPIQPAKFLQTISKAVCKKDL